MLTDTGQVKRRIALKMCGVHYDNRGGVFPVADTVKGLACKLAIKGFSAEEADHQGACVQAPPAAAVAAASETATSPRQSFTEYNLSKVAGHPTVQCCFDSTTNMACSPIIIFC